MNDTLSATPQPRIFLVDDDPIIVQALRKALAGMGALHFATSGEDALRLMREHRPDLVLLDAELGTMSGFQVAEAMHGDPVLADVPVIFVTKHNEAYIECAALERGAVDFISKPVNPAVVAMRVKTQLRLKQANDVLREFANVDGLTGLLNRRSFEEAYDREWKRAQRNGNPLSVLMLDVDYFKRYNDLYGHGKGDECLISLARAIKSSLRRPADMAARYGGEEFVCILPETDARGALEVGGRILNAIEKLCIPHGGSETSNHVTVSIGAASLDHASTTWVDAPPGTRSAMATSASRGDLLEAADIALYGAKTAGRAQQCFRPIDAALTKHTGEQSTTGGDSPRLLHSQS
jgi:diguanylate cyclase (GGDEF)-like protein